MTFTLEKQFQVAILSETQDDMAEAANVPSIEWLRAQRTGESSYSFLKGDGTVSSANLKTGHFDLPGLLGVIVVGSSEAFQTIKDEWNASLPAIALEFRRIEKWDREEILAAAIDCIAGNLAAQRSHSGRASLELATYRREFDRLQRSFTRLEEYVGRQSFPMASEVFEYPPDISAGTKKDRRARLDRVPTVMGGSLTQYLPADSLGLSSFSIYIGARPETAGAPLRVTLQAIETGKVAGAWEIDSATTGIGWVELALNHAMDAPALSLLAIVEFPEADEGWALALGPPHPYKEFCASTGAGKPLSAPIAIRIFRSLPGVRVAPTSGAIRPVDAPHVRGEFVPYEAYAQFVQVAPSIQDNKPTLVFYDRDIGCLTVHPRIGGLTVARLNVAVPQNAWGFFAQIYLAHEKASVTEFGLMAWAPGDEKKALAALEQLDAPSPFFSGWKPLQPLETKTISIVFAAPPEKELAIYLLTRQAPESSPDFAWARFSRLGFHLLPVPLQGQSAQETVSPVAALAVEPAVR